MAEIGCLWDWWEPPVEQVVVGGLGVVKYGWV